MYHSYHKTKLVITSYSIHYTKLYESPPLGAKRVMGIDPGFRTGCKIACLDRQGTLLHHDTIYPHMSQKKALEDSAKLQSLCKQFQIEAIAVGNGTAGRETEAFVRAALPTETTQVLMSYNFV